MASESNAMSEQDISGGDNSMSFKRKILSEATTQDAFPQGCQFSPDGLCILTAQNHELMLYDTTLTEGSNDPAWRPALTSPAGDSVRAYQWYPHMKSSDPATCCFVGAAR